MRCLLLAFAFGVLALQQQPELPARGWATRILVALLIALLGALATRRLYGRLRPVARAVALTALAVAVAIGGFFYAAWRADTRLSEELPSAWEGRDIEIRGVVDELPQPGENGTRFAFAVERVLTEGAIVPARLSLSWYRSRDGDGPRSEVPELHAGERWQLVVRLKRPHGTINPHGFDLEAWLLENQFRATGYVRQDDANRVVDAFAGRPGDHV